MLVLGPPTSDIPAYAALTEALQAFSHQSPGQFQSQIQGYAQLQQHLVPTPELLESVRGIARLITAAIENYGTICSPDQMQAQLAGAQFGAGVMYPSASAELGVIAQKIAVARAEVEPYFQTILSNPREELQRIFGVEIRNTPKVELIGCALVIQLEGYDYGRISDEHCFATLGQKSYGATLFNPSTCKIPEALQGRLVLANEGDGKTGVRTQEQVRVTRDHEISHVIFNTCFRLAGYPDTNICLNEIKNIENPGDVIAHTRIAEQFNLAMGELARSEFIAYNSTGVSKFGADELRAELWGVLISGVKTYLATRADSVIDSDAIVGIYENQKSWYELNVSRYSQLAARLFEEPCTMPNLNNAERTAVLYHLPLESASLIGTFLPEGFQKSA